MSDKENIKMDRFKFAITGSVTGIAICIGGMFALSDPLWYTGFTVICISLYLMWKDR